MQQKTDEWWGDYQFDIGSVAQWKIGPLQVAVQRQAREWLVTHNRIDAAEDQREWHFAYSDAVLMESNSTHVSRFVRQSTGEKLTVLPALADRPVVSRPFTPFTVPADEHATIYVSTPLWFTLSTGQPSQTMCEIPIQRPSDTWFGPSTQVGESCYASRTYARLNLENVIDYPHRAVSEVHIHNKSNTLLLVERLNLPVLYLSLFHTPPGLIWTETVTMVQTRGTSLVEFNIEKDTPPSAAGAKLIALPRRASHKGMLIRAFSALKLPGSD